jgi:hypothetical protein
MEAKYMNVSGSSNLGTLFKIGSLAAVTYYLLKWIKGEQAADLEKQHSLSSHCRPCYPTEKRASVKKIKIESFSPPVSSASSAAADDQIGLDKGHAIGLPESAEEDDEKRYMKNLNADRESPAHILANVKEPQTMQALDDTLSSPTPVKESNTPEGLTMGRDKEREKLAAIEAIECMAANGNPEAKNLLFKHVQNEDFLVRYEAIRGIIQYGEREDRELLQQTLPAGDWYIMDIRPEDMRKVC